MDEPPIGVVCGDDNADVIEALRITFERAPGFAWRGAVADVSGLGALVEGTRPDVVVLDIDMPGRGVFEAAAELPARVVFYSGHVRSELIDRALDAGAWGYVSKSDGEAALLDAVRRVARGEIALSDEVRAAYGAR